MRYISILFIFFSIALQAQKGIVRGNVYDKNSGEPIGFCNVFLEGTTLGNTTDINGFFTIADVPVGEYKLVAQYIGYDSTSVSVKVKDNGIVFENLYIVEGVQLEGVEVSARRDQARNTVQISKVSVSQQQIKALPSTGGVADIAQYLPVLPGVIVSGDQGGQLYIRGGSPVQNKILLDGMTIYNPFHSIGFFSVFETETIRSVDVLTGGFNAEYGGRISAVVDIKTREGNKKRLAGKVGASPFQANAILEGPIVKLKEDGGGSTSFLLTAKQSLLDRTSKSIYSYADTAGLPYTFTDLYGKLSLVSSNGSKLNLFGFNFQDQVNFEGTADLNWDATGAGLNFTLVPPNSNIIVGGSASYSNYDIGLIEADGDPRSSGVSTYNIIFDFSYYGANSEVKYGFEFNGFNTDFSIRNFLGQTIRQRSFTTELAAFVKYKQTIGNFIMEPGFRLQYYASQSQPSFEPRLGFKYNITDWLRLKGAAGMYSQNLVSSVNERDIVNLFVGFLAGPEQQLYKPGTTERVDHRLQKSIQGVIGFEVDVNNNTSLNIEPYYKNFTQLINLNRSKTSGSDPDFITETGEAYGIDFSLRYEMKNTYVWGTYSYAYVNRNDGFQTYPTVFDRRHNINFLVSQSFGKKKNWEASVRWNYGSGFPFTLTQGFFTRYDYDNGVSTDILSGNGELGVVYDEDRNAGRLPDYHRLDISLKKLFEFSENVKLEVIASVTNVYDRENIFYFDRIRYERVNQLPILPSLGANFSF
ncbi:MAG: TonB-dependent receptor [Saprospiraceae bacterium]|nr:TonB-dependent receptor [Saprospiraceae bacterium]